MGLEKLPRPNLSGIPSDYLPVTPDDSADNTGPDCTGLYIQNAGNVAVQFRQGFTRVIPVAAGSYLPGEVTRVLATGTSDDIGAIFACQG